jgi:DNA (cytosine-5)-methyltransferase 1
MTQHIADSEIRTKGSFCAGVGGLDQALPGTLTWVAENNDPASEILKLEHPEVDNLGDVTIADFPAVDLFTAGFPCQPVSSAGRQKAHDDHRWLWPHVLRGIGQARPAVVFLENVQNIRSIQQGSVMRGILSDLQRAGYASRWTVLGACAVGAPHHRHRWFLRAEYVGQGAPDPVEIKNKCGAPRTGGRLLLPTPTTADGSGGPGASGRDGGLNLRTAVMLLPTPRATDIGTPGRRSSDGWRPQLGQAVLEKWEKYAEAVALWEQIRQVPAPDPTVPAPKGGWRLNPALSEWMMGYRAGMLTDRLARNDALRCAGNGVVPMQAEAAWEMLAGR